MSVTYTQDCLDGITVQPMAEDLTEALVGYRLDSDVGPTIILAMGGEMSEIYVDAALELGPVDHATARLIIESVRCIAFFRGYRGMPCGDLDVLTNAVVAFSGLENLPEVKEAEINPLIVKAEGQGVVAVDRLVRLG